MDRWAGHHLRRSKEDTMWGGGMAGGQGTAGGWAHGTGWLESVDPL